MSAMRRISAVVLVAATLCGVTPALPAQNAGGDLVVTLLGTATPVLSATRFGPSTLVQAGGVNLVFDAGRGASIRLSQAGVPPSQINVVFFTHYHSDHINGFADIWMTGYLPNRDGRKTPLQAYGPAGLKAFTDGVAAAYRVDTTLRGADPAAGGKIEAHEYNADGVVFDRSGVKVTAFRVDHVEPAYGYRVDYQGKSVLISGDTRFNQNLIDHGKGVDLLIHEVSLVAGQTTVDTPQTNIFSHTSPEDTGKVFAATNPKMAVYSHILWVGDSADAPRRLDILAARTRRTYSGPLTIGEDMLRFTIGDSVTVIPLYTEK